MKSYHSHEVFNFGLFHPDLPLLLDLLNGEQAGSLVRLKDGAGHQCAHLFHPGEGGRVDEGAAATERVVLLARRLGQAFHPLLLLDGHTRPGVGADVWGPTGSARASS